MSKNACLQNFSTFPLLFKDLSKLKESYLWCLKQLSILIMSLSMPVLLTNAYYSITQLIYTCLK